MPTITSESGEANATGQRRSPAQEPFRVLYASDLHGSTACYNLLLQTLGEQVLLSTIRDAIRPLLEKLSALEEQISHSDDLPRPLRDRLIDFVKSKSRELSTFLDSLAPRPADAIVIGGDLCPERIAFFVEKDGKWVATVEGEEYHYVDLTSPSSTSCRSQYHLESIGYAVARVDQEVLDNDNLKRSQLRSSATRQLSTWLLDLEDVLSSTLLGAQIPYLLINTGSTDPPEVDDLLSALETKYGRVKFLGNTSNEILGLTEDLLLVSCSYREVPLTSRNGLLPSTTTNAHWERKSAFETRLERLKVNAGHALAGKLRLAHTDPLLHRHCILNMHVPPYGKGLDEFQSGPEQFIVKDNTGSISLADFLRTWHPFVSLHGYSHYDHGAEHTLTAELGDTQCITPGSRYTKGHLSYACVDILRADGGHFSVHLNRSLSTCDFPSPTTPEEAPTAEHLFELSFLLLLLWAVSDAFFAHSQHLLEFVRLAIAVWGARFLITIQRSWTSISGRSRRHA